MSSKNETKKLEIFTGTLDKANMFSRIGIVKQKRLVYGGKMAGKTFLRVEEVASELGVSPAYAYKLIRRLNGELEQRGFITINGRVSRQYFIEKLYGNTDGARRVHDDRI